MKLFLAAGIFLLTTQATPPAPKNNPNGTWESNSGTKYALRLSGKDLHVEMVEGSNSRYLKYEVELKNEEEANTYSGAGYFVAKLSNGKECKYSTEWKLVVVTPDRIFGSTTNIVPDPGTCGVKEKNQVQLDLKKK